MNKTPDNLALSPLTALSPLDGRYEKKIAPLRALFSEYGLIRFRVQVEIRWLLALSNWSALQEVPTFSPMTRAALQRDGRAAREGDRGHHQSRCEGSGVFSEGENPG
jgi:adenylosuccinate lyase